MRYEDIVANPDKMLRDLYRFSEIPFTQEVENHIHKLTHAQVKANKNDFGVARSESFDSDHWKQEMKKERILEIEHACKNFMNYMNYEKL